MDKKGVTMKKIAFVIVLLSLINSHNHTLNQLENNMDRYDLFFHQVSNHYNYEQYYPSLETIKLFTNFTKCNSVNKYEKVNLDECLSNIQMLSNIYDNSFFKLYPDALQILKQSVKLSFLAASDYNEDLHHLKSVAIRCKSLPDQEIAFYHPKTNTIYLDLSKISSANYLQKVLAHEINHVRQTTSLNNNAYYSSLGESPTFAYLMEASAESQLINYANIESYAYEDKRKQENYLLLTACFKENKSLDQYYEAIFNTDFTAFYNFFNLQDIDDYQIFYNINYTFNNSIKSNYQVAYNDILKIVLKDLLVLIHNDKITKEELHTVIIFLNDLYKNEVNDETYKRMWQIFFESVQLIKGWDKTDILSSTAVSYEHIAIKYPVFHIFLNSNVNDLNPNIILTK